MLLRIIVIRVCAKNAKRALMEQFLHPFCRYRPPPGVNGVLLLADL
jgi:hypothetical protein